MSKLTGLILASLLYASTGHAQITIDVSQPLTPLTSGIGINTNFLMDDDATHLPVDRTMTNALYTAGMKFWRFPEGELADVYGWHPTTPTLLRTGPNEWPANDRRYTLADNKTLKNTMTFDEFMGKVRSAGATPVITVAYDSMYKPATEGGTVPTREQLIKLAADWVRHANIKMRYGIKYWEIGNESYIQSWVGGTSEQVYAADLIAFSQAMKAVDPSIIIGANVHEKGTWMKTVLQVAGGSIDWVSLHNYPVWGWGSFEFYRANNPSLMDAVNRAVALLDAYAPGGRIKLAVTEFSALDWSGEWPHVNDMGHALVTFDLLGALELHSRVLFSQYWVTRWPEWGLNALTPRNGLTPVGQALAIWGQSLGNKLNVVYRDGSVVAWLTEKVSGERVLLLRNMGTSAPMVRLNKIPNGVRITKNVFSGGPTPTDTNPQYWSAGYVTIGELMLPPMSITVLTIRQ